ncbi:gamma-glutamyltransferase [Salinisphaera sp. LB1]|uniref:gamma-glutamyltransferase n=1 Tax=Salinisphaera sp. LB1 TaxID=2183911 RepID=UPI000D708050
MHHPTRPTALSRRGMVSSPHYLASAAGQDILRQGGSAVDAAIAVNATLGVVFPHMTGIGGDAFWLIHSHGADRPIALNGSGRAVGSASRDSYRARNLDTIPHRGALAAVTVPGAVDSWCMAHARYGRLPLSALLAPAIEHARDGYPVGESQARFTAECVDVLRGCALASDQFMPGGRAPEAGELMRHPTLADTLEAIARFGRAGFYEGEVAAEIVRHLGTLGQQWTASDLANHRGDWAEPLSTRYRGVDCYQTPPNSQGFAHLIMLNILAHFDVAGLRDKPAEYVHLLVAATREAFAVRDRYLTDPVFHDIPLPRLLSKAFAGECAERIKQGLPNAYQARPAGGDTTATMVVDGQGNAVSLIQSIYHEWGAATMAGDTGVLLQNRGAFFSLDDAHVNRLEPGKRSFHTLMPGMAYRDGRPWLVYGTMGGEGQPQTSTALLTRMLDFGLDPQRAIDAPRWLYGRSWGTATDALRVESRFDAAIDTRLAAHGHEVCRVGDWDGVMGHAAAIRIDAATGVLHGAADPRGEGIALGW